MPAIFITGRPGAGKSTCLSRVAVGCAPARVDGVISGEILKDGRRAGFQMRIIGDHRVGLLASPDVPSIIRFGTRRPSDGLPRLGVTHDFLRTVVCAHLDQLPGAVDLIVVDEIGAMQATCAEFRVVIMRLLASSTPVVASVSMADEQWINSLRSRTDIPTLELTVSNREVVTSMLVRYAAELVRNAGP